MAAQRCGWVVAELGYSEDTAVRVLRSPGSAIWWLSMNAAQDDTENKKTAGKPPAVFL
jgi:hypothetical protein